MPFERVGTIKLSKSGRAVEIILDKMPHSIFTSFLYIPKSKMKLILEDKLGECAVSLLVKRI